MKIIFFDIDGTVVIGDDPACFKDMAFVDGDHLNHFNKKCVDALNHLTDQTGAKLVISSVWRGSHALDTLKKHFKNEGVTGEIIGATPILRDRNHATVFRGIEIQCWLSNHDHENIESFVIIDDDSDACHLIDRLVKTEFRDWEKNGTETGLTMEHAAKAIIILGETNVPQH